MIVTVFRSRLRPENLAEYGPMADRMDHLARQMPGFVSAKTFTAEDGERVTLVEMEDEAGQRAWASHGEHVQAKAKGRSHFYSEFKIQVCNVLRQTQFKHT